VGEQLALFSKTILHGPTGPDRIQEINEQIRACQECGLCLQRTQPTCGAGNAVKPILAIVTGAPDTMEDLSGAPIVGRPGEELDLILKWLGLAREDQFLTHVVACKPKERRPLTKEEIAACRPLLYNQLRAVEPQFIVTFGEEAAKSVLYLPKKTDKQVAALFGTWQVFDAVPVMPTISLESLLGKDRNAKRGVAHEHLRRLARKLRAEVAP